jgi:hypothetical protein
MDRDHDRATATPDGIGESHIQPIGGWRRHASPLSLVVFGTVVVLGLTGLLGHERDWHAESDGHSLAIHAPEITRNGEFLEMRIAVESERGIDDVVIGVDAALWEDMTVNTMIPAATEETSEDGEFRFTFGPLTAGTTFDLKIDLQVNPDIVGGNEGMVTLYDGDEPLVPIEVRVTVLP